MDSTDLGLRVAELFELVGQAVAHLLQGLWHLLHALVRLDALRQQLLTA